MNPQIFSTIGYVSVLLWLGMLLLWAVHAVRRPRRWLCHVALVVGLAALVCAKTNSMTHVNRIQVDRSEELAAAQKLQEEVRKAREKARAEDVAQVRFAEDDATDFLDTAGMDDAEKKYLEHVGGEQAVPAWKQQKKTRSSAREDGSLEGMLELGAEEEGGMDAGALVEEETVDPILMSDKDKGLANRLDGANLNVIRWLLLIGVGLVVLDYLRRANVYEEAYWPLPLPSALVNSQTPVPVVWALPVSARRSVPQELAWLSRRGDAFVYLTDDTGAADVLPEQMCRLPRGRCPVDVLRVKDGDALVDDTFIFEALWYNRASFVVDSVARAEALLEHVVEELRGRKETRARVRQTVHIVWDVSCPMPEALRAELVALARVTGLSLVVGGVDSYR